MKKISLISLAIAICTTLVFGQSTIKSNYNEPPTQEQEEFRRHFLGSSLWVLFDKFTTDPAGFYQFNYGYQFSPKDVFLVEAITWSYNEPLGTYENSKEKYPGDIRAYGIGVGYQRFHWKNLFTSLVATPFVQQFYDTEDEKIQKGFQLYTQFILGYRIEFFQKRLFIEPAYALKYWPVNTNFPASFAEIERGAPKHKFEPSLNFGIKF